MLITAKQVLNETLHKSGITLVYMDTEDESKIKGNKYAWIMPIDPEQLRKDGNSVVISGGKYYICEYERRLKVGVRIAASNESELGKFKTDFSENLIKLQGTKDTAGFEIDIVVLNAEFISDKSVLKTGCAYDIYMEFSGGIYTLAQEVSIDPWLEALSELSIDELGREWSATQFLQLGSPDKYIYWKTQDISLENQGAAAFTVRKQIIGYVYGDVGYANMATTRLAHAFQTMFKLPLNIVKRYYMTLNSIDVNLKSNAQGAAAQIVIRLSRMTSKPVEDAPLMMRVNIKGELQDGN